MSVKTPTHSLSSPSTATATPDQLSPRSTGTHTTASSNTSSSDSQAPRRRPHFLLTELMMQSLRKLFRQHAEFVSLGEETEARLITASGLTRFLLTCTQPQGYDDSLPSLVALRRKLDVDSMLREFGWVDYCGQRCLDLRGFLGWYKDFRNVHHVPSFVAAARADMARFGIDCSKDKVLEAVQQQKPRPSVSSLSTSSSRRSSVSQGSQPQQPERKVASKSKPDEWQVVPETAPRSKDNTHYYTGGHRRRHPAKQQQKQQAPAQQQVKSQSAYAWIGGVVTAMQQEGMFDAARELIRYREKRQDVFRKRHVDVDQAVPQQQQSKQSKQGEAGAPVAVRRPSVSALLQRLQTIVESLDERYAKADAHVVEVLKRQLPAPRKSAVPGVHAAMQQSPAPIKA